jgi:hypothetical protein
MYIHMYIYLNPSHTINKITEVSLQLTQSNNT